MAETFATDAKLLVDKHVEFIQNLDKKQDRLEYWMTEHLRVSGIYWGLVVLFLLRRPHALDHEQIISYVLSCQNADGGFGGHTNHDSHLLYTMSSVQILAMLNALDRVDGLRVTKYVLSLQTKSPMTTVCGDKWGEHDTRFAFIALAILSFFNTQDQLDVSGVVEYVRGAMNYDGGFGSKPGGESHAAQVYTSVAALALAGRLDIVDRDRLSSWLAERQLPCGGLNGRPQKLEDVCYAWWVGSALDILQRRHWIQASKLASFVLSAQDEKGGIADRPGDVADVYHTCFGIAGLALVRYPGLEEVDPVYCMPRSVVEQLGLDKWQSNVPESWSQ
ncbi:Rab geranylgeranyltransferase [Coemansia sp. RSA 1822]|nr:Rab geranylgeranyltransferase [Coemansia sp. RSA 638]KAJ2124624.1 Rab geranylgeranyltransferase [Coemansia sp. RSA 720]KAJ2543367.1 Rab geranylgeranyltransferase [Coemansia sp. RSA 1853]KAJ2567285.1 Rab geranylgeranyltransferase [Coemansia sp. RSA 1822]